MMNEVLVQVENVSKKFCKQLRRSLRYGVLDIAGELFPWRPSRPHLRPGEFWALRNVSFELRQGQALGILGPNGAGKSTLLKLLNGLIKPDAGRIAIRGRVGALIRLGMGFSPTLSGRENISINAAMLGMPKKQIDRIADEIIDFAGIREFIDAPVQTYSSGMWVRLGYAIAAHLNPDVLLVDEVLAVGDLAFKRKCLQHMQQYLQRGGALVLVSHNIRLLQSICDTSLLLRRGRITFAGPTVEVVNRYVESQVRQSTDKLRKNVPSPTLDDDHPVVIEDVTIAPRSGDELGTGRQAHITVSYRSIAEIDGVFWGFGIWTGDQWVCVTADVSGFSDGAHRVVRGRGQFHCTLPRLPLVAGAYALKAIIGDATTGLPLARFGWENAPTFFSVRSATDALDNLHALRGHLTKIEVRWE